MLNIQMVGKTGPKFYISIHLQFIINTTEYSL